MSQGQCDQGCGWPRSINAVSSVPCHPVLCVTDGVGAAEGGAVGHVQGHRKKKAGLSLPGDR